MISFELTDRFTQNSYYNRYSQTTLPAHEFLPDCWADPFERLGRFLKQDEWSKLSSNRIAAGLILDSQREPVKGEMPH